MKYQTKPVIKEAEQLTRESAALILEWIKSYGCNIRRYSLGELPQDSCYIQIETLEGVMTAKEGDYIIKGLKDEFYPCDPDIFEKTYEKVQEEVIVSHIGCGGGSSGSYQKGGSDRIAHHKMNIKKVMK